MSTSTDGLLFWGYCFDEEGILPGVTDGEDASDADDGDEEGAVDHWEIRYAASMGLEEPNGGNYSDESKEEFKKYWDARRRLIEASGCTLGTHCSCDVPMYYVAIASSEVKAWRGYPRQIGSLVVGDDWREKLDAFCKRMGIAPDHEPGWWLASLWC